MYPIFCPSIEVLISKMTLSCTHQMIKDRGDPMDSLINNVCRVCERVFVCFCVCVNIHDRRARTGIQEVKPHDALSLANH